MYNYKIDHTSKGTLTGQKPMNGEMLEAKVERVMNSKEGIKDGAPIIYTARKDGLQPQYDIRTDRWEIAIDGMDKVAKSYKARREERAKPSKNSQSEVDTSTSTETTESKG